MRFWLDTFVRELRHGALAAALFVGMIAPGSLGAQGAGTITGTVSPASAARPPLRVTVDQKVCGHELPGALILRGSSGALANTIVTLVGVKATGMTAPPTILNEKCRFVPRVKMTRPQASVTTTSTDSVLHTANAQHEDGPLLFNVGLPVPGIKISNAAGDAGLVRVSCNTHPWMFKVQNSPCGAGKLAIAAASVSKVSKISPSRVTSSSSCTRRAGLASFSVPPARATVRLHDTISPMHELSTNDSWPRLKTMFFLPFLTSAVTRSFSCPVVSSIVIRPDTVRTATPLA